MEENLYRSKLRACLRGLRISQAQLAKAKLLREQLK